jgi:predicted esterase
VTALLVLWLADVVTLKDGRRLEGRVTSETAEAVVVRTLEGTRRVPRDQVSGLRKSKSVYDAFDEKLEAAAKAPDEKKKAELLKLAAWAAAQRLVPEAARVHRLVLQIDPNHAASKKAVEGFDRQPVPSGGSGGGASGDRQAKGRSYYLHVPSGYSGAPAPLLLWLHADGGNRRMYLGSLAPRADKHGFLILSGEGGGTWRGWSQARGNEEDLYLMAALDDVKRQFNVDLARVFVAGHSRGATYTSRIGTDYAEIFAGAAMHNGVWTARHKHPSRKTPFFIYTGEKDYLAKEYGCAADAARSLGHEVEPYTIPGAGHEPRGEAFDKMFQWFAARTLPKSMIWEE